MKRNALVLVVVCATLGVARAESDILAQARSALDDGLPSVTIYRLQNAPPPWSSPEEQQAANLLMARALNSSGRYAESVALLRKSGTGKTEEQIELARALAALGQKEEALAIYQKLSVDPTYAQESAMGSAAMLQGLGRAPEAEQALEQFLTGNPTAPAVVLALAGIHLSHDPQGTLKILSRIENPPAELSAQYAFLAAQAHLSAGEPQVAEDLLKSIHDPPADLAGKIAVARAECLIQEKDLNGAEKILEKFVDENNRLPDLDLVFAELDRVYTLQGVASGTELRRWADDMDADVREALALYYLARNEARNSKIDHSRQLYRDFLQKHPDHPLVNEARCGLAASFLAAGDNASVLQTLEGAPAGGEAGFLKGLALAAQGNFRGAADSFAQAAQTPELKQRALFNAAVCEALTGTLAKDNAALQEIAASDPKGEKLQQVRLTEALFLASTKKPEAGALLKELAGTDNAIGHKATLALAEWQYSQLDLPAASATLRRISTNDPADQERMEYLAVFLADTGLTEAEAQTIDLAQAFLKNHPASPFVPDVRMKLGEILFRRGDYLGARSQFSTITEDFPASPLAEKALFLSAQSMARSMDPTAREDAIETYEDVVKAGGPLAMRARLAQVVLYNSMNRSKEALGILDRIQATPTDPDIRAMALIEKGDTLFSLGGDNPDNYRQAIAAWQILSSDPAVPSSWSNQALAKMGAAYEKLGDNSAALNCYYSVFSRGQKGEPEYFWFYKAGFDAGRMLETQKLWNEAIAVYEKIGSLDGPRAEEARNRVNALRLENFLWEN